MSYGLVHVYVSIRWRGEEVVVEGRKSGTMGVVHA